MAYSFCSLRDVNEVAVINQHLIRREEVDLIRRTISECIDKYRLQLESAKVVDFVIEYVEISKKMVTTAGTCFVDYCSPKIFRIKLAYSNYVEFGTGSMIKTLRHEMAHLIELQLYGTTGHSERFKRICVSLDGHMNRHIAGNRYKDHATTDYCKKKQKGFKYKCDCGVHFTVEKRFSVKQLMTLKCRQCDKTVKDMKVEIIIGV